MPGANADGRTLPLDIVCIGRAAVDLYGEQIGARLEDVTSFARYLGGSPANTAVGCARLGLRAAMLTRVGDEQNGAFVLQALVREGVDVSQVKRDPRRLTALVFLSIRSRNVFPLLFYRDGCADMALSVDDVDPAFIANAQAVLISGTHLSQPGTAEACRKAISAARAAGRKVVLDIDYRPVLWGLRPLSDGETRYVAADRVTATLQSVLADCDLVVGTEEEICIAGGEGDIGAAVGSIRALTRATLVVKRGPQGCDVHSADSNTPTVDAGCPVEVFNVLGAGDAFMAGFLSGWLRGAPLAECARRANACGALVVSRHGCAPAIPSAAELEHYLRHGSRHQRLRDDAQLNYLHRVTTRRPAPERLAVIAFDHRIQLEDLAARSGAMPGRISQFKRVIAQAAELVAQQTAQETSGGIACGLILDDRYGAELLPELDESGWWIARPVEVPGSRPLRFEGNGNVAALLRAWPAHHVAKCLVAFDADDERALREAQLAALRDLAQACADTQRELLLEVIPPRPDGRPWDHDDAVARAIHAITATGVLPDWWKLGPPQRTSSWTRWSDEIQQADPYCRGVLLLGLDASIDELAEQLDVAASQPICRGFAIGRTIFNEAARAWFERQITDAFAIELIAARYRFLLQRLATAPAAAAVIT
jgi:5-dehydro-2-deoxygluconokinase